MRIVILLLIGLIPMVSPMFAQTADDQVLTYSEFINLVEKHHPVAFQANLRVEMGKANLLNAKGKFDPKVSYQTGQKQFENTEYYNRHSAELKIPTWLGPDFLLAYEQNQGYYLNPESGTPQNGLWFGGISIPLGEGLMFDKRRAEVRKAQQYRNAALAEKEIMMNELILNAGNAYWKWYLQYETVNIYQDALAMAETRYKGVKSSILAGDKAGIDSVEASIYLQNIELLLTKSLLELAKSEAEISVFLWENGALPLELNTNVRPEEWNGSGGSSLEPIISELISVDSVGLSNPLLRLASTKVEINEIEKKWMAEQIKPTLNLKYNALNAAFDNGIPSVQPTANYTFGMEFAVPLYLRSERGNYQMAKLNLLDAEYDLKLKSAKLETQLQKYLNEYSYTQDQILILEKNINDYETLLNAEKKKFAIGESSLFLINYREMALFSAKTKMVELKAKNAVALIGINYVMGGTATQ